MALAFARQGYLVCTINYRLAPRHPYPAAIEDAAKAYTWVTREVAQYGGDLSRLVLAGESAGANLATGLTIAATFRRPEPFAAEVFSTGVVPRAVLPACGILQVSDTDRFRRRRSLSAFVMDRVNEVEHAYLGGAAPGDHALADPLCILESDTEPARALPPFFTAVGTADPLLDDTRRLKAALDRRGVPCETRYYPGELHAFHAFVMLRNARRYWTEAFRFLHRNLRNESAPVSVEKTGTEG
jgi:acetyl esterase